MGRLLASVFDLRREERDLAFMMAAYHFLLLVTLYLLKPVRDSIFLSSRGPSELPYVFILTTVVVAPVAALHTRAGDRLDLGRLIDGVSLFLVASLFGLRVLLWVDGMWVTYALYTWVSIYGLLVTSQFWLLANALFTSSQSKRVFTVLSAGAIVGAIAGGEITGILVDVVEITSENLLLVAGGVLLGATALGRAIRALYRKKVGARPEDANEPDDADSPTGALQTLRTSRHLQLIVGIVALMVIVTTFVDYQFKTVAARAFPTEQGLTAFMGQFYGRVSVVALLVQFVLAPRLMRVVGIGGALSILPGALALGSLGMLILPGLAAGILLRGAGQSLKHSLDKTGRELLFVPVSLEKKKRVKVFVDLFIDQGAEGLGGILLLGLVVGLGLSVQLLSLVTLGLIAVWAMLAYRARQSYVDQYRAKLRNRQDDEQTDAPDDETPQADLDEILDALCSHAETEVLHALEKIENDSLPVPVDALLCVLDHPAPTVRKHALRVFRVREVEGVAQDAVEALRDPDPDVVLEAARYLYCQETDNRLERLKEALQHEDPQIQAAAVGLIAEEGDAETYRLVSESLLRRLVDLRGELGEDTRTHVARILGVLDRPYRNELLHDLLRAESPQVLRAAIEAAGQTNDRAFVDPMVQFLKDDALEAEARKALASFGASLLGTLYDYLTDERVDFEIRRRVPPIFTSQPSQLAVTLLVRSLRVVPIPIRHAVIRALSKIYRAGDYECDTRALDAAIGREVEHYAALGQILHLDGRPPDGVAALSADRMRSHREETLERLFRLLGLRYHQRDIYDAYLGITSGDPSLRDSAVEFIDNLVDYEHRRYLLPLLDDHDENQAMRVGAQFFDLHIGTWETARHYLRTVEDPRLTALIEATEDDSRHHGDGHPSVELAGSLRRSQSSQK